MQFFKLLQRDPSNRFSTAAEIKRHPWFKNLKWQSVALKKMNPPLTISVVCCSLETVPLDLTLLSKATGDSTEHFDKTFTRMTLYSEEDTNSLESEETSFNDFDFDFGMSSPVISSAPRSRRI